MQAVARYRRPSSRIPLLYPAVMQPLSPQLRLEKSKLVGYRGKEGQRARRLGQMQMRRLQ